MQICHEPSCVTHKPVDDCVLFGYRVNQIALKNVDNDVSVNLTGHVLTGTVGGLIAVWGKSFKHKVFMLSGNVIHNPVSVLQSFMIDGSHFLIYTILCLLAVNDILMAWWIGWLAVFTCGSFLMIMLFTNHMYLCPA
jgi:hypothetical protein